MKTTMHISCASILSILTAIAASLTCNAALYNGNGNTSFGGAVGNGQLSMVADNSTISATFTKGSGPFDNILVLYFDTKTGGYNSTANFTDAGDAHRSAISGYGWDNGNLKRSTATFATGFSADYALAVGGSYGGLWQLSENSALTHITSVGLSPVNNSGSATYTFSLNWSDLGLGGPGSSLKLASTYISTSAYRSGESFETISGTPGWNNFTFSDFDTLTAVPEPAHYGLICAVGLVGIAVFQARRGASQSAR